MNALVVMNELRAGLLDERNWAAASVGAEDLGLDDATIEDVLGFSIEDQRRTAQREVDELIGRHADPALAASLATLRQELPREYTKVGDAYATLESRVADSSQRQVDRLLVVAGEVDGGSGLIDVLRILESATLARQATTALVTEYFALEFAGAADADANIDELVEQRELYLIAMSQIARMQRPDSHVAVAASIISESPEARSFTDAASQLTDELLTTGFDVRPTAAESEPRVDPFGELVDIFLDGVESSRQHLGLIDAAADDVTDVSASLSQEADDSLRSVIIRIVALAMISLTSAVLLARVIRRPLRDLSTAARRLRDGDTGSPPQPSGPAEVREAAQAISEAAGHLALAEQQAKALAQGAFDHPILAQTAPGALGASLQEAVQTLAASLSDREEFRRLLTHEATHDALTQLANRRAVMARLTESLARTRRTSSSLAVMFLDLDDFKGVNDHHGHLVGDAVLRTVSQRLLLAVRKGDHVGRLGGDEFLIVAEPVSGFREALRLAERLLDAVQLPIAHGDGLLAISGSVGIALVDDSTNLNAEEVLRDADLAVYQAKSRGRARIELCDEDLRSELERRTRLEDAIRTALAQEQLRLHYQVIVDPATGTASALEALVRWQHPVDGLVGPDAFIPFAERTDLILDIDRWVVVEAARQLQTWTGDDGLARVPVAVNISGRHLVADDFVDSILQPLADAGVRADRLIVEITESALLDDLDNAAHKLEQLRAAGVRIAIDDFGTGYTSLAHLRTLPMDILKIDRSFTVDPNAASLVQLIIDTGHLLGARITAEGVETIDQATALTKMGADELQGYLYARPVPPDELDLAGRGTRTENVPAESG